MRSRARATPILLGGPAQFAEDAAEAPAQAVERLFDPE
jgi:hypothetical protein